MTSKQNKLSTPTKPAPVELHDEALDAAAGGDGILTIRDSGALGAPSRKAVVAGNFIGTNAAGTAA